MTGAVEKASAIVDFVTPAGTMVRLSRMGFGAAPIGNMGSPLSDAEAISVVTAAVDAGLSFVDVAPLYGHGLSERRVGAALAARPDVTLSTKVGRLLIDCPSGQQDGGIYVDLPPLKIAYDYSYDGVMRSWTESRARLGRPIDILFVHDFDAATHGSTEGAERRIAELFDGGGWRALEDLRASGEVSAIGAGVNDVRSCLRMLELGDPDLLLLAGRYTLLDQSAQDDLLPRCIERGVGVIVGGPFNSGILATGAVPGAWYDYAPANAEILARTARIEAICRDHGISLATAALQFPLRHPMVLSVIPGARSPHEVARNASVMEARVPPAFWSDLRSANLLNSEHIC